MRTTIRKLVGIVLGLLTVTGCSGQTAQPQDSSSAAPPTAPASSYGPAQNVPKPVPPEGIDMETTESLEKFIDYWNQTRTYAIQTGDTSSLRQITGDEYEADLVFIDSIERLYNDGGWINGLQRTFRLDPDKLTRYGNGLYGWTVEGTFDDGIVYEKGNLRTIEHSGANRTKYEFFFKYENGSWKAVNATVVP